MSRFSLIRRLFQPTPLILVAAVIVSVIAAPRLVESLPSLGGQPEYRLPADRIAVDPQPPRWVPADLVEQVVSRAGWPEHQSLLDEDLVERVAEGFRGHPWVAEVIRVEKSMPPRVVVTLKYRRVVAVVEWEGFRVPVDTTGVRLPAEDVSPSDRDRLPVVKAIKSAPPERAGVAWDDPGVAGAVRLADLMTPHWHRFSLEAIQVETRPEADDLRDRIFLSLTTRGGSRVIWGRVPGTGHPGELTAEQKIARLEQFVTDLGSLDPPHGPYEINIRHWREIIYRPLHSDNAFSLPVTVVR